MSPKKKTTPKKVTKKTTTKAKPTPVAKTVAKKPTNTKNKPMAKKTTTNNKVKPIKKEEIVLESRTRKETPSIFKIKSRKATPVVFSLEDVQDLLKNKPSQGTERKGEISQGKAQPKATERKTVVATSPAIKKQVLGAASISDILGFNPKDAKSRPLQQIEESKVPKHLLKYYKELIELRTHVKEGLDFHSKDTLKRSSKDDAGDLSSYSQHMADAGTDTFDRDFALNLLSSEQDALYEIEEAIQRILKGTYGVCEITNKPINKDRLKAVPFTRYSIEGQQQLESKQRRTRERGGLFAESSLEESAKYTEDFEE